MPPTGLHRPVFTQIRPEGQFCAMAGAAMMVSANSSRAQRATISSVPFIGSETLPLAARIVLKPA